MSVIEFSSDPWRKSHKAYEESAFQIRPAPEFSTAEVVLASVYRSSGFPDYPETNVPKAGKELDRLSLRQQAGGLTQIGADTWHTILHGVLESPKQPNQSSKRFLSLCPLVPDIALYSGSARLAGNSWNPGALIKRMIQLGAPSYLAAQQTWGKLHEALSIGAQDDIWARWLDSEFTRRRRHGEKWQQIGIDQYSGIPDIEKEKLRFPAKQFVRDLGAIIEAKQSMTRRQWISLLEGVIRLGAVSHVLWLCRVNDRLWKVIAGELGLGDGKGPTTVEQLRGEIMMGERRTLSYGNAAVPMIRDYASRYLLARLGINLVLWGLAEKGVHIQSLQSADDLWKFIKAVEANKSHLAEKNLLETFFRMQEEESRSILCKKGIGSNLVEFGRHTLGQRQTTNNSQRGYDQSYFLQKKSDARNAPWVLCLGPVAVLAVVHCCLKETNGPRSVQRLSEHLANYGIEIETEDINESDLGRKLRMLGLVLDSPDAESGMLLVPPFGTQSAQVRT